MSKHTQGKFKDGYKGWRASQYAANKAVGYSTHEIHFSDDGECVAEVVHGEANAKLIAAAPELLEACKKAAEYFEQWESTTGGEIEQSLKAAIKKATL